MSSVLRGKPPPCGNSGNTTSSSFSASPAVLLTVAPHTFPSGDIRSAHAWALRMSPDGNVWGATVNKTAGDAEKLDDVVFPLFPQGGGFPRNNDDKT